MMKYERLTDKRLAIPKGAFRQLKSKEEYLELSRIASQVDNVEIYNCLVELEDKIEQGTLIDISTIAKLLNEWFECPCNFTLNEEDVALYMYEKYGDWCEKHCGKMAEDNSPCWEMYLKAKLKELKE